MITKYTYARLANTAISSFVDAELLMFC